MSPDRRRWTAWVLVTTGGIAVALATLEAASGASEANGKWQEAVRAQTRFSAATVSNIQQVYVDEAPLALSVTASLIRAQELERRAGPAGSPLRTQARAERAAAAEYVKRFRAAQGPVNELVETSQYTPDLGVGSAQLGRRLATLQAENRHLADDVRVKLADGDAAGRRVNRGGWGIVAGALVALAGLVLWRRPRKAAPDTGALPTPAPPAEPATSTRGPEISAPLVIAIAGVTAVGLRSRSRTVVSLCLGTIAGLVLRGFLVATSRPASPAKPAKATARTTAGPVDAGEPPEVAFAPPELPPVPPDDEPAGRTPQPWSALPAMALGLIAAVVTAAQIQAGTGESRLLADAARRADVVAGVVTGGLLRETFMVNGQQAGLLLGQRADDLAEAGGDRAQAAADNAASARIVQYAADIGVAPRASDGVDPVTQMYASGLLSQAESMRADQQRAAEAAAAAGKRSDRLVIVLFALTLAASLVEIGRSVTAGPHGSIIRRTGLGLAGLAALTASLLILFP